jgi:hypothetical protein
VRRLTASPPAADSGLKRFPLARPGMLLQIERLKALTVKR